MGFWSWLQSNCFRCEPLGGRMQKGVAWVSMARRAKFMGVTASGEKAEVGLSKGPFRAARGTQISCKGWQQEAALRMLMNNLDPEVAEKPEELIVYGGTGKAARNWECFHAIVRSLRELAADETLLVQSGKPVGIFRTH